MKYILNAGITGITLVCLVYNTITDIRHRETHTAVLYLGSGLVGGLQLCLRYKGGLLACLAYLAAIVLALLLLAAAKRLLKDRIGAGDYDVLLLLYLSAGWPGLGAVIFYSCAAAAAAALPLFAVRGISRKTRVPCVPFLLFGYLAYQILGGLTR